MAYSYAGSFDASSKRRTEQEWRQEIIKVCRLMWEKDYISAGDGNVSVRLADDRFLVTPSGFSKGFLQPDQLLVIDWDANIVGPLYGANRALRPSSEVFVHLESYRRRSDIVSVVHAHPPMAVALSIAGISLAKCILPEVVATMGLIPTTQYATPSSIEGAEVIAGIIEHYDALILQRHGSVTVGTSAWDAYLKLEKLEHTAIITKTLAELGKLNMMSEEDVAKLVARRAEKGQLSPAQAEALCNECNVCAFPRKKA
jgi:L-fuculose-phosphate aldolase